MDCGTDGNRELRFKVSLMHIGQGASERKRKLEGIFSIGSTIVSWYNRKQ